MTRALSKQEFIDTMRSRMLDFSDTAEPVVDIWPYVAELVDQDIVTSTVLDENLVEKVYRNIDYTYEHVLLPTSDPTIFIVIVVDRNLPSIYGHYRLNLTNEYEL